MSKYIPLWEHISKLNKYPLKLTFEEICEILGFPIDHSFLSSKKETKAYGFAVEKISLKEKTVIFEKLI